MLSEHPCKQITGEPARRWLCDDYFDLILWRGGNGEWIGFQVCYDVNGQERALTWMATGGFSHTMVDSGESDPGANYTPILLPATHFPTGLIHREFELRSRAIDPAIRTWVLGKIAEYGNSGQALAA